MDNRIRITQAFRVPGDWRPFPTDAFDVKVNGRHGWLKRILWRGLQKLGAVSQHFDREMMMKQCVIDPEEVTVKILHEARMQFLRAYGKRAVKVYIGMEDLANLMNDPDFIKYQQFSFNSQARMVEDADNIKILDLTVEAIPHMRGILVV